MRLAFFKQDLAAAITALTLVLLASVGSAQSSDSSLPRLVQHDGRYALFVDGAPYILLGAQVNNSSAWPSTLPQVWPALEALHANTVEMPVYWEQFEPEQDRFDYSVVDTLLTQSREHHLHLVLLWFGTWKNGSSHYMPAWMKRSPDFYTHVIGANGRPVDSPSPFAKSALRADISAFSALMGHLKAADPQHTVLMIQVENEPGTWGSVRDYSPAAQKVFDASVPAALLRALQKQPSSAVSNWREVFGDDADEFFHAWAVASYIEQVAAAGKAIYPLPLYVNAALRDPFHPHHPPDYETGGPTDNVIPIWKAMAPSVDLLAPDIYLGDNAEYLKVLDLYSRPDNALFVPETANHASNARYFFAALGRQAIGFSPFGMDYTGYSNAPLGAPRVDDATIAPFALNYELIGPMVREIARLNFEGKLQAVAEEKGRTSQTLSFGKWNATVFYGLPQFGFPKDPPGNPEPIGRALIAQLADDQFLVAGFFCRVDFAPSNQPQKQRDLLRVEEGTYENGEFKPVRIWNGDQSDWGLNFTSKPQVLRVSLGAY